MSRWSITGGLVLLALTQVAAGACGPRRFLGEPMPEVCRGQEEDRSGARCMGWILDRTLFTRLYDDPALTAYVDAVGQRVAAAAERPDLTWTFRILDEPGVHAYALLGGYVYVSRGALAYLGSEAELAALLGHEIGHIAAGHSEDTMMALADATTRYDNLFPGHFRRERDEERQADELAVRYVARAGYDPRAVRAMLAHIHRDKAVDDDAAANSWDRTHPPGDVRMARVTRVRDGRSGGERGVRAYLRQLDGLVLGRDPRNGFLDGQRYINIRAGLVLTLEAEWTPRGGEHAVHASASARGVHLGVMPIGRLHYHFLADALTGRRRIRLAGRPAIVGWLDVATRKTAQLEPSTAEMGSARVALVRAGDLHLAVLVAGERRASVVDALDRVARGFRALTAQEQRMAQPSRIAVIEVERAGTVAELSATCPATRPSVHSTVDLEGGASDAQRQRGALLRCVRTGHIQRAAP